MGKCKQSSKVGRSIIAASLVLGLAGASRAALIGDFETSALDGWNSDGTFNSPSPAIAQSTTGVTNGAFSLASTQTTKTNFWGPATGNLIPSHAADLASAVTLSYDLTLNNSDLNGGAPGFNGFAQDNEIAITLFSPTSGSGINVFSQQSFAAAGKSDSSGQNAGWNGVDGTRHIVWDLTKFTAFDPTTFATETLAQIVANNPDIVDAKIGFSEQTGGATATVGAPTFFFDNVRLNPVAVPEPGTLSLLALSAGGMLVRRRRSA